jgi:hypothetical protein
MNIRKLLSERTSHPLQFLTLILLYTILHKQLQIILFGSQLALLYLLRHEIIIHTINKVLSTINNTHIASEYLLTTLLLQYFSTLREVKYTLYASEEICASLSGEDS